MELPNGRAPRREDSRAPDGKRRGWPNQWGGTPASSSDPRGSRHAVDESPGGPESSGGSAAARPEPQAGIGDEDGREEGESGGSTTALPQAPGASDAGIVVVAPPSVVEDLAVPWPDERGKPEVIDGICVKAVPGTLRPPTIHPQVWKGLQRHIRLELIERYLQSLADHVPWVPFPPMASSGPTIVPARLACGRDGGAVAAPVDGSEDVD